MKKLLLLSFWVLFSLFFKIPTVHAIDYSASATAKDLTITIKLTGPTSPQITVQPVIDENPIISVPKTRWFETEPEKKATDPSGTTELTIKASKQNTLYHIRVLKVETVGGKEVKQFITNDTTVTTGSAGEIFSSSVSVKKTEKNRYDVRGNINLSKHKDTDNIPLSTISVKVNICKLDSCRDPSGTKEVILQYPPVQPLEKTDGLFVFTIDTSTLDPGTDYDLNVIFDSTTGAHTEKVTTFNTEKGVPLTGKALDNSFDKNSYRLLAPIPGMVALLDPALCQERKLTNPGQICDVNAFLNFILNLIIGLAAVVLVVRLIIEGFGYMTTDIPFNKARAKGNFKEALIGLVIALSSYLILNTINPRLVNNDLKIGVAEFGIDLAKELGHENVVGTPSQLSPSVDGYGPFNITGDGVIAGNYQSGPSMVKIVNKIYPPEMEKGNIGKVKTIVLHNTMGNNAASGWLSWVKPNNPSSCHFLVEKDGTVWQNARLTKGTNCQRGDPEWGFTSSNSIGIEIVGCAINAKTGKRCEPFVPVGSTVEAPTPQQVQATIFLVNYLNEKFGTTLSNLLTTHGKVQTRGKYAKLPAEGQAIYDAVKDHIIKK